MLSLVIGLLTLVMVLTSLLLILMILVQLPKKEAGLGMAFGGATADALFGAGSGTVLTRWTKYATGIFLVLALFLSVLRNHEHRASARNIAEQLGREPQPTAITPAATSTSAIPTAPIITIPATTNQALTLTTNLVPSSTTAPDATTASEPDPAPAPTLPPPVNPVDNVVPPVP